MQTVELSEGQEVVEPSDYEKERGKPMPNLSHGAIQIRLGAALLAQAKGRYIIVSEVTFGFDATQALTPDLAVLPARSIDWGLEPTKCCEVPLLVVEIYSPTQGYLEVMTKREMYFERGVKSVWVVQPASQSFDVYTPGVPRPQIVQCGEVKDDHTGLTVQLEDIFA